MTLAEFLSEASRKGVVWADQHDCCMWLADWVLAKTGVDPGARLRGRYRTATGCLRVLRQEGGVLALVSRCAVAAGLPRTDEPRAGDIGVVRLLTASGLQSVGAICTGPRWAALALDGLVSQPASPVAAWRV